MAGFIKKLQDKVVAKAQGAASKTPIGQTGGLLQKVANKAVAKSAAQIAQDNAPTFTGNSTMPTRFNTPASKRLQSSLDK